MPIYAIVIDEQFREWRELFEPLPPHTPGSVRPRVDDALPVFDPSTQKVVEGTPVVEPTQVRRTWIVVPLLAAELDDLADKATGELARKVYTALKNGTGTTAQRQQRVEEVAAFLLKQWAKANGLLVE